MAFSSRGRWGNGAIHPTCPLCQHPDLKSPHRELLRMSVKSFSIARKITRLASPRLSLLGRQGLEPTDIGRRSSCCIRLLLGVQQDGFSKTVPNSRQRYHSCLYPYANRSDISGSPRAYRESRRERSAKELGIVRFQKPGGSWPFRNLQQTSLPAIRKCGEVGRYRIQVKTCLYFVFAALSK